jgi:hypothetical protein
MVLVAVANDQEKSARAVIPAIGNSPFTLNPSRTAFSLDFDTTP